MSSHYLEIEKLENFKEQHNVTILNLERNRIDKDLSPVLFKINDFSITVQIQDEYDDLKRELPLLNLYLVLRELSYIEDSSNFQDWCKSNGLIQDNEIIFNYYLTIIPVAKMVSQLFLEKKIDYFISDLDFQLSSGPMAILRKS